MIARLAHDLDILALARVGQRPVDLAEQHVGETDDRIQRRAQFMADGREEAAFRHFQPGIGLLHHGQFGAQSGHFRIVAQPSDDFSAARATGRWPATGGQASPLFQGRQPQPHLDLAEVGAIAKVGERAEEAHAVADMHALEEAGADQKVRVDAQQVARCRIDVDAGRH